MFDRASNVQLAGELLQIQYPMTTVMRGVEHTISLFSNDVSKIPVVNHMIRAHNEIYIFWVWNIPQTSLYIKIKII